MPFQPARRQFVGTSAALAAAAALPSWARRGEPGGNAKLFRHGVASGDPLQERVILWTRISPATLQDRIEVRWRITQDPALRRTVASGRVVTDAARDFTVKIDATGLRPGTTYYYQFSAGGAHSPVGRTKTLAAAGLDHARLAVACCANYPYGFFNVYALIAQRHDLDAVLHLGDYLYEYANADYGDGRPLGRVPAPDREIVSLSDYRERHACYKGDADLQEAHRQHPWICIWDDHESANDSWMGGAENHQPDTEGDWLVRKTASIRAYREWMPVRDPSGWLDVSPTALRGTRDGRIDPLFRSFRFGDLADLIMLDTRLYGRDDAAHDPTGEKYTAVAADDPTINDPRRSLLGLDQEAWLYGELARSKQRGATWQVLGQQIMMAQLSLTRGATLLSRDQWDGYKPSRDRLFAAAQERQVRDLVVLTGDQHNTWANDLTANPWGEQYDAATGRGVVGVEYVVPAVSSPGLAAADIPEQSAALKAGAPHMRYVELQLRGYGLLDLTPERAQGEFWHVDRVDAPSRQETLGSATLSLRGKPGLVAASGASQPKAAADPAP
jgi:alkaline phosphatase D